MKRVFLTLLTLLTLCGCSSYSDQTGKKPNHVTGGFTQKEVAPGVYFIIARTGFAPWKNESAAMKTFLRRAAELCPAGYDLLWSEEAANDISGLGPYVVSQFAGYIRSKDAALGIEEAQSRINTQRQESGLMPITQWKKADPVGTDNSGASPLRV
jgi:hypothetical protein